MELILIENVENVGSKGDVIRVRDGFARNFLIPRKLAMAATRANQAFVEEQRVRSEKRKEKERVAAVERAEKMQDLKLQITAKVGEKGKLFGAITAEVISEALKKKGHAFTKKQIQMKEPIRSPGTHVVSVEIYSEVKVQVTIDVVAEAAAVEQEKK